MLFRKKKLKKTTPEDEARFAEELEENEVGFQDRLAMVISAMLVIVLPCLLILLGLGGIFIFLTEIFH